MDRTRDTDLVRGMQIAHKRTRNRDSGAETHPGHIQNPGQDLHINCPNQETDRRRSEVIRITSEVILEGTGQTMEGNHT